MVVISFRIRNPQKKKIGLYSKAHTTVHLFSLVVSISSRCLSCHGYKKQSSISYDENCTGEGEKQFNYYCCTSVAKSDWSVAQSCQAISANVKENRIMERCFSLCWLYGKPFSSLRGQPPLIFSHLPRSPSPSPITPAKQANHFQNVSVLSQGHTATLHTIPYITCMQSCIQSCIQSQPTYGTQLGGSNPGRIGGRRVLSLLSASPAPHLN